MMKRTILAGAVLTVLLVPGVSRASSGQALVWRETRQEIPNGSEISLWEQFNLERGKIPCQAEGPATLTVNGQSTDSVSGPSSPGWSECGSVAVTGGFTSVQFDPQTVTATADPAISIAEPAGCVYEIGEVEGSYSAIGAEELAAWKIAGSATLTKGTPCSAELHLEGFIELFPRGAGSPLPWRSLESLEREAKERESEERAAREEKEHHEAESALTALTNALFPSGMSARISGLLKANGWGVSFAAPWPGELVINWYEVPKGAHLSKKPHPTLVASGRASFTTDSQTRKVTIRLTAKGQRLLKKAKRISLTAKGAFLSFSKPALIVQKTFALRR
jgi:hypothetical protein